MRYYSIMSKIMYLHRYNFIQGNFIYNNTLFAALAEKAKA